MTTRETSNQTSQGTIEPSRYEDGKPLLLAGLRKHFTEATIGEIGALWQRFAPHIGGIPGQAGGMVAYGACFGACGSEGFDYLCGVQVLDFSGLGPEWSRVAIPAQRYAVFGHRFHVSRMKETVGAIFDSWLPTSGHEAVPGGPETPDFFERYTEDFDPGSGMNGMEVWLPIRA